MPILVTESARRLLDKAKKVFILKIEKAMI